MTQPCTTGTHTTIPPIKPGAPGSSSSTTSVPNHTVDENGVETYGLAPKPSTPAAASSTAPIASAPPPVLATVKDEEDDLSLPVPEGARCKRLGCEATWEGEGVSRGQGAKAQCRYHPQSVCLCFPFSRA